MERRIGEQFKYEGVTLEVAEAQKYHPLYPCCDCYFLLKGRCYERDKTGKCSKTLREDKREIYFKEVKSTMITHKIMKRLDEYYIHLAEQNQLCSLADYLSDKGISVNEVKYIPSARQGVIVVRDVELTILEELIKSYNDEK